MFECGHGVPLIPESSGLPVSLARFAISLAGLGLIVGCATTTGPYRASTASAPDTAALTQKRPRSVSVRIDEAVIHQTIEGFGATHNEYFNLVTREDLMGSLRERVIESVYGQVGITMGQIEVGPYETFDPSNYTTANDNDDPFTYSWRAFNFVRSGGQKTGIVDRAMGYGFDNFTIHSGTNVRWSDPWMAEVRRRNYQLYLQEMAENVVAPLVYWREKFGIVPRWHHLFNEPTTGNRELAVYDVQEVVDLVKVVGARFRREGFKDIRLVVASEETEEASLASARAILADPEARRYVGAISYHTYPYGSVYSNVNRILETSGVGEPDAGRIEVRNELRDLARQYGLQVWMTEVSNGQAGRFDSLLGRAIHIHDELLYADASSYWAMYQAWDTHAPHGTCGEDCPVIFDRETNTVTLTGIGYAIGHYARWIRRGVVRVDAKSDDPMVLATAFRDEAQKRIILVVINNHHEKVTLDAQANRPVTIRGTVIGEQSSAEGFWVPIDAAALREANGFTAILPGRSVTSFSAAFH